VLAGSRTQQTIMRCNNAIKKLAAGVLQCKRRYSSASFRPDAAADAVHAAYTHGATSRLRVAGHACYGRAVPRGHATAMIGSWQVGMRARPGRLEAGETGIEID